MKRRIATWATVCLMAITCTVEAARLEDLQDQLKSLAETFTKTAKGDIDMNALREDIMTTDSIEGRKKAFDTYKDRLATLLEDQDTLLQRVNAALRTTKGLDFDQSPDLAGVLQTFNNDLKDIEQSLKMLQASAMTLRKSKQFSKTATVLAKNLDQMRKAFATLIKERQQLLNAESGKVDKSHMINFLEALKISAATRQQTLFFEFTMTAQAAQITDHYDQLRQLYETLLKGKSFSVYLKDMGVGNLESATYLAELNEILLDETFVLPNPVDDMQLDKVMLEIGELDSLYPYEVSGVKYYYDADKERWYCRNDGKRVYCPIDEEAVTGKFTRMHLNGYFYSHAPWYDEPRQLTFSKDWIAELNAN